jgi:hypothetical protein
MTRQTQKVSEEFLGIFAASATAITDFEKAMERDKEGNFMPFEYDRFKQEFTLQDLVCYYLSTNSRLY